MSRAYKEAIRGAGNTIIKDSSVSLKNCKIDIIGNNNTIRICDHAAFNNFTFYIRGDNNKIHVSKNTKFNRGGSIWIEDYNCEAKIGAFSSFEDVHIAVTEPHSKIIIGKDCMFANDIDIRTGDSHSLLDIQTNNRINYAKNIHIGDHVWVASHVSILKGVRILSNSVIATRSVVTKSFKNENILIGGVPAKVLKEGINWERKRIYENKKPPLIEQKD